MRSKKGAIELSVNAIVIFVIALGMLGVGLFIIAKLKAAGGSAIDGAFNMDDLQQPPSSQDPIVFEDNVRIKFGDITRLKGGYYNTGNSEVVDAEFDLDVCKSSEDDLFGPDILPNLITVVSSQQNVKPSQGYGFNLVITHKGDDALGKGTYVCTFVVKDSAGDIKESKSVFVEIVS